MKLQSYRIVSVFLSSLAFSSLSLSALTRSQGEIRQIAQSYFEQHASSFTRGTSSIEYLPSSIFVKDLQGQEAFYLCNHPSEGFVLVPTDASMPEIFGYSSTSYHAGSELPSGLISLMHGYAAMSEGITFHVPLSAQTSVEPMLKTKWDQGDPFNRMCPRDGTTRSTVGCVATAAAQVMKYYRWPEKRGTGKISYVTHSQKIPVSVDLSENTLAWDLMLDEYLPDKFSNAQANAVAKLMYAVGAASQMDYSYVGSGSSLILAAQGLSQYFGYDKDMFLLFGDFIPTETWNELIVREINQARPVVLSGFDANGSGHAFVLDGYDVKNGSVYYHINWGWNGNADGYYLVTNLTPTGNGSGSGLGSYDKKQMILLNFQPDDGKTNPVYAQVDRIIPNKTTFKSGEEILFDLELKDVFCFQPTDFSGSLQFEVVNESGAVLYEESLQGIKIPFNLSVSGTRKDFHIQSLPDGVYTLRMYLMQDDGKTFECISGTPWPKMIVGNGEASIDGVVQEAKAPSVYDLKGVKIKTASKQLLPAGFYVEEGRKVLVR